MAKTLKHHVELDVPEKELSIVTIGGYKFFNNGNSFQCATCTEIMGSYPRSLMVRGKTRKIKLVKDCDCPPQK